MKRDRQQQIENLLDEIANLIKRKKYRFSKQGVMSEKLLLEMRYMSYKMVFTKKRKQPMTGAIKLGNMLFVAKQMTTKL